VALRHGVDHELVAVQAQQQGVDVLVEPTEAQGGCVSDEEVLEGKRLVPV
jgi:hypothetical protein